jgi:hypothetical protein
MSSLNDNLAERRQSDALTRWGTGHQLFSVLMLDLIVVHKELARHIEDQDWDETESTLTQATQLWAASAVAFRFTGDFTAFEFESVVRPSMAPPNVREGFSGTFSPDHTVLLQVLSKLRPLLGNLPPKLKERHRTYLWVYDAMYESHASVCHLMVGNKPSLKSGVEGDDTPAPEKIRHLKTRALRFAGHTA